jgi:hypothetical protein
MGPRARKSDRAQIRPSAGSGGDIVAMAGQLRAIRVAARQFLFLWLLEDGARCGGSRYRNAKRLLRGPQENSWATLYGGDVLDD